MFVSVPPSSQRFKDQTGPTEVNDEFYRSAVEQHKFLPIHKTVQMISFIFLFGVIKLPLFILSLLLFVLVMYASKYAEGFFISRIAFQRWRYRLYKPFLRITLFFMGVTRVYVDGAIDTCTRFIVSNHPSHLDALILLLIQHLTVVVPPGSKLLMTIDKYYDVLKLKKDEMKGQSEQLKNCASDPTYPTILSFPEGGVSNGVCVSQFHTGSFLSDYPVQPVAISYKLWFTIPGFNSISFSKFTVWNVLQIFSIPMITANVTVLPPLKPSVPRTLAKVSQMRIANELGVLAVNRKLC